MRDGFVRVAAGTPEIRVADCLYNAAQCVELMREADRLHVKVLALPELCLTGYTCGDLFLQKTLLDGALEALRIVTQASEGLDLLTVVGFPLAVDGKLFNCGAVVKGGAVLGVVPKMCLPNYSVYYEMRHFAPGIYAPDSVRVCGAEVPFGGNLVFRCEEMPGLRVAVEICEDLWVPDSPSVRHALAGATLIVNPSASDEAVGKGDYRRMLVRSQSAKLICGYVYAGAGPGESSTDLVFAAHDLIAENGVLLAESVKYECGLTIAEIDVDLLDAERRRMNTYGTARADDAGRRTVPFHVAMDALDLIREVDPHPFVPSDSMARAARCEEILAIQTQGLMTRLRHTGAKAAVVGVSGGLDSTLALLVTARAFRKLGLPPEGVAAVTMPGFGTTRRTRGNAGLLAEKLDATLMEIPIGEAVELHFRDIGHAPAVRDVTYENSQARERTQVLMDLANKLRGLVIGTGDMSELALGWATYNGDHMSMYGVNVSVPKTLVKHLVRYEADRTDDPALRAVLLDILDTPVSPELLPPDGEEIAQRTEDLVGPYELHDFFLYHAVRRMCPPRKVLRLSIKAFGGRGYDQETIKKWLSVFYRRFFGQQFKRSCLPDGPKVGSVALSPRGDWRMPSDASDALWRLEE